MRKNSDIEAVKSIDDFNLIDLSFIAMSIKMGISTLPKDLQIELLEQAELFNENRFRPLRAPILKKYLENGGVLSL